MQRIDPSFGSSATAAEPPQFPGRHASAAQEASAILTKQWASVFVAVFVSGLVACVALLALDARQGIADVLDRMIAGTQVVVFLDPQISPQESDLIGSRLKADPGVGSVHFRSKEAAAGLLAEATGGPDARRLALPDAWILSLRASDRERAAGETSLPTTAERLRTMALALPGVQSVHFDRVWVGELDRWIGAFRAAGTAVWSSIVAALFASLLGIHYLANRAMWRGGSTEDAAPSGSKWGVSTYIGVVVAAAAGIATFVLHALAAFTLSHFVTFAPAGMQTWLTAFGHSRSEDTWAVAAMIVSAALVAGWLAAPRQ